MRRKVEARTAADVLQEADQAVRRGSSYAAAIWPVGFTPLDSYLGGGLRAGELTLIGGPQGLGKTTFAMQVARNIAVAGGHAIYVCYEHGEHDLLERLLGMEAGLLVGDEAMTLARIRSSLREEHESPGGLEERLGGVGSGDAAVRAVASYGSRLRLVRSVTGGPDLAEIRGIVETAAAQQPVVFVDYLQKVPVAGDVPSEDERVTRVVEGLKELALAVDVPVVAIVAADRDGIGAGRTRLHHLRGSTALAYEADVALMLNEKFGVVARHHLVYDAPAAERFRNYVVCSIEKNRAGLDRIDLEFRKHFDQGRFDPVGVPVAEQLLDDRIYVE